jgi:hypothetical protein
MISFISRITMAMLSIAFAPVAAEVWIGES